MNKKFFFQHKVYIFAVRLNFFVQFDAEVLYRAFEKNISLTY